MALSRKFRAAGRWHHRDRQRTAEFYHAGPQRWILAQCSIEKSRQLERQGRGRPRRGRWHIDGATRQPVVHREVHERGRCPSASSWAITPKANTSALGPTLCEPPDCSGAM